MFIGKRSGRAFSVMSVGNINPAVVEAKYAVRGEIVDLKNKIKAELDQGKKYPFTEFCELNIGNPQIFKMRPITFFRDVLAAVSSPELLETSDFSDDVKKRAFDYLNSFKSLGAYTEPQGNSLVRHSVAEFIERRDAVKTNPDHILIYNGASEAIANFMELINVPGGRTGFMIPIPQYPLYSAQVQLCQAEFVGYLLDEENVGLAKAGLGAGRGPTEHKLRSSSQERRQHEGDYRHQPWKSDWRNLLSEVYRSLIQIRT
jgi:alanine transaminase